MDSALDLQVLTESGDVNFGIGAGGKDAVKAHGQETLLDFGEGVLADDDIAANVEQDVLQAGLVALLAEAAAVQLALTVEGRDDDGICIGLDGGLDELLLGDHNAEVHDLKASFGKCIVKDLVADGVDVSADNAKDQFLIRGSLLPPHRNCSVSIDEIIL